jgi:hypothetical protein
MGRQNAKDCTGTTDQRSRLNRADASIEQDFHSIGATEKHALCNIFHYGSGVILQGLATRSLSLTDSVEEVKKVPPEPTLHGDVQCSCRWLQKLKVAHGRFHDLQGGSEGPVQHRLPVPP